MRRIPIQPAKSNKSTCHNCNGKIDKDDLRAHVEDATEFNEYIKKNGGTHNLQGEGLYRGYFETEQGVISKQRYYVHLKCYHPVESHPWTKEYFKLEHLNTQQKNIFNKWLKSKNAVKKKTIPKKKPIQKK